MLFYNVKDKDKFEKSVGATNKDTYIRLYGSEGFLQKEFTTEPRELWISYKTREDYRYDSVWNLFRVYFEDGHYANVSLKFYKSIFLPTGDNDKQTEIKITNYELQTRCWSTIRIHVWIDEDNSDTIHFSLYVDSKPMIENATSTTTNGAKFSHFANFKIYHGATYEYYYSDFIISDKFFGESAKIKEIPITQIKSWTKNLDTGKYYASKVNQQGTLVIDPLLLADLEKYNVVSTAIAGIMTREGDNIKNLEVTVGDKKINQEISYGINNLSIDVGNDLTALSNITVETKG